MTTPKPTRSWSKQCSLLAGSLLAYSAMVSGCFNGSIGEPGASCTSTRTYFLTEVWGPVMGRSCVGCHAPGGQARLAGARFELLPASYPNFADYNLAQAMNMVNQSYNVGGRQVSALLAKPLALTAHGGNAVLTEGSAEHRAMEGLVQRLQSGRSVDDESCVDYGSVAPPSGVVLLDWRQTLRRTALDLVGRLPTDAEYEAGGATQEGFETVVRAMMEEPAFYRRWRTAWNDLLLTDRYVTGDGCDQRALNLLSSDDFPNRGAYAGGGGAGMLNCCGDDRNNPACGPVREFFLRANNAIAQEPINLFEHVIRTNRPFSEVLTADYVLVNPQSAFVYGVGDQASAMNYDASELREARVRYNRVYGNGDRRRTVSTDFPHAGVLTTAAFLARYPTTTTNRNRHRARIVQSYFLATDILKVGERPIDPTASEALVQTPTLNYGPCVTCHRLNDPIAGAFRGFFPDGSTFRYNPEDDWYTDMFPPGFENENMPASNYRSALQWLAPRVANDERFVASTVRFIYTALTGRDPLAHPTDQADPQYAQRAAAWNEQDRIFRAIGRRFSAANRNFKEAVLDLLESPLYRAAGSVGPESADDSVVHQGIGSSRLLTPELLDQRIRAIAGTGWVRDLRREAMRPGTDGWLRNDFYFPYGGINSDTIVRRTRDAGGITVGVAQRMGTEVACRVTAHDFLKPAEQRRFFRSVALDTVPESAGSEVPGSVARIRENIAALHFAILGENVAPDAPEVTRTYQLFLETWRETRMPVGMSGSTDALVYNCQGRWNLETGEELPQAQRLERDTNGTIRAWMAVLTYLFTDYRFLYQ